MYLEFDVCIVQKPYDSVEIIIANNNLAHMASNFEAGAFVRLNPIQRKIIINRSCIGFAYLMVFGRHH